VSQVQSTMPHGKSISKSTTTRNAVTVVKRAATVLYYTCTVHSQKISQASEILVVLYAIAVRFKNVTTLRVKEVLYCCPSCACQAVSRQVKKQAVRQIFKGIEVGTKYR